MPKAYKEVYEIVKHLSEEDFNKIPKEVITCNNFQRLFGYRKTKREDYGKRKI